MRILLTGGTGYLGQSMVRRLAGDHEIICLVRPESEGIPTTETIRCDLSQPVRTSTLPEKIDAVVFLAQSDRYNDFPAGTQDLLQVNIHSVASLLDYTLAAKGQMFLMASSGSVYEPFELGTKEDTGLHPKSFYAATKVAAEALLWPYQDAFEVCAARLWHIFGPGQKRRLVPNLIESIVSQRPIYLAEDGEGARLTPTHVDDAAEALKQGLLQKWSGPLNVSAPEMVSIREVSMMIGGLVGQEPVFETRRGTKAPMIVPDLTRFKKLYDLAKFRAVESGLKETVAALDVNR